MCYLGIRSGVRQPGYGKNVNDFKVIIRSQTDTWCTRSHVAFTLPGFTASTVYNSTFMAEPTGKEKKIYC